MGNAWFLNHTFTSHAVAPAVDDPLSAVQNAPHVCGSPQVRTKEANKRRYAGGESVTEANCAVTPGWTVVTLATDMERILVVTCLCTHVWAGQRMRFCT